MEFAGHWKQGLALAVTLRGQGVLMDVSQWNAGSWFEERRTAVEEINAVIGHDRSIILIDDDRWSAAELCSGRRILPCTEKNGLYWGPPADDATAVAELKRLRAQGAEYLIFAWSSFWRLEQYRTFHRYIRERYPCMLENERLKIFDLSSEARIRDRASDVICDNVEHVGERPVVSVIINNYNYSRFLGAAIESALNQSYPRTEVIVVDDGSTDGSREVISRYANRVMPVFKANGGQASAFNSSFPISRGAIVCFLDADDLLLPEAMERVAGLFEGQGVVKVHWSLRLIDDLGRATGQVIPRQLQPTGDYFEVAVREGPTYDWHSTPPTSGNAWARWFLEKVLPIPEVPFRLGGDEYLLALAPAFGLVRAVEEPLGCYRTHGNNCYFNKPLDADTVALYQMRFAHCSKALRYWLDRTGVQVDADAWSRTNFNAIWLRRLKQARTELCSVIPEGHAVILIDDCELGNSPLLPGRKVLPFLEKEGLYWGPPADSAQAIGEFERLRGTGVTFLALWWTSYWWTNEYDSFWCYLTSKFALLVDDECIRIFDLRKVKG